MTPPRCDATAQGYRCSLAKRHRGPHVALSDDGEVAAAWARTPSPVVAVAPPRP